jgi:predicted transcriptional regulator
MADDLSDFEIAVLCDLLQGPGANLRAHKKAILGQLVTKGLVESAKDDPGKFQLTDRGHHVLEERGVGISGG